MNNDSNLKVSQIYIKKGKGKERMVHEILNALARFKFHTLLKDMPNR